MRLNSDSYFENISRDEVIKRLQFLNELIDDTEDLNELKERLKRYERTRYLQIWHDGSVILNHGHLLFALMLCMTRMCFTHQLNIQD